MTPRFAAFGLLAVSLAGSLACGRHDTWREFVSKEGGFRVRVPGAFVESTTPAMPFKTESKRFLLDRHAAGMLQVVYYTLTGAADMSPETVAAALRVDCEHAPGASAFVTDRVQDLPLAGHPGVSVTGRAPKSASLVNGGWGEDRCFLVGTRLYHLVGVAPDTAAGRADVTRFLDSFTLESSGQLQSDAWRCTLIPLTRRALQICFVIAIATIVTFGSGRSARAATNVDAVPAFVCDALDDGADSTDMTPAPLVAPQLITVTAPAAHANANGNAPHERLICFGNPLTDDPDCWANWPGGAPHPRTLDLRAFDDLEALAPLVLPRPDAVRTPFVGVVLGAQHPGFARGIDRPPRHSAA